MFICAAGNDAKNLDQDPIYPAAGSADLDCVISVAATDRFDNLQPTKERSKIFVFVKRDKRAPQ